MGWDKKMANQKKKKKNNKKLYCSSKLILKLQQVL